jgi:RNA polymerase sigma-70 factor, ECF subfamily
MARSEREALVKCAIDRLTPTQRTILQLRDWEDLTYDEIAHVLSVPVGTVRSRLHNARAALAQALVSHLKGRWDGLP